MTQGNWCYQCRKADTEPAGETCVNPRWHIPNANTPRNTEIDREVRLPYAED